MRKLQAKQQKRWRCDRNSKCKAKLTSYGVYEDIPVWRCSHDRRNKGMSDQKCDFDICKACMTDFIENRSEGEIVLSSDEED